MRPRDIFAIGGLLVALAAVAVLSLEFGAEAAAVPEAIDAPRPIADETDPGPDPAAFTPEKAAVNTTDPGRAAVAVDDPEEEATSGAIEGTVAISTDVLHEVDVYHIRVVELTSGSRGATSDRIDRTSQRAFKVPKTHTPRFRMEDIPFSRYGYRVELLAKGFNGGSEIVRLDATNPLAEVSLSLSRPVVFTVRLQDQHHKPHGEWPLELRPVGDPPGRFRKQSETDRFGTALFEDVVAGKYAVFHEDREIGTVQVQATTQPVRGQPIRVQSSTLVVPVGRDLRVEIFAPNGYGLPDVQLVLYKTDTVRNRRFEAHTDLGGIYTFEHLEPGRYQLDVHGAGYQRKSRTVTVDEVEETAPVQLRLAPLRR